MKRLFALLAIIIAIAIPVKAQKDTVISPVPKDSLPNLWVVSIDLSGSMTSFSGDLNAKPNTLIYGKVVKIMKDHIREIDSVIIMRSGIDKTVLLSSVKDNSTYQYFRNIRFVYTPIDFAKTFIGKKTNKPQTYSKAISYIDRLCKDESNFVYNLSFTSLVRPLSMYVLKENKTNFLGYNKIYHILVTDDGEANDQWNEDYRYLKKYVRPHFDTVCKILPQIACSNFDFASKQTAKFEEIKSDENQPRVYLTQYVTYQDIHADTVQEANSLLKVNDFHNNSFKLTMRPCGDSICFVYVKSCWINGGKIDVNQYLYRGDSIPVTYPDSLCNTFRNSVSLAGSYQEEYKDHILGQRYRTVCYKGEIANSFVSAETIAKVRQCLLIFAALLLVTFLLIWIRRNRKVLRFYVNGKEYAIKRKALKRMNEGKVTIMSIVYDDECINKVFFYRNHGISIDDSDKTVNGEKRVFIHSLKKLTLTEVINHGRNGFYKVYEYNYLKDGRVISYSNKLALLIKMEKQSDNAVQQFESVNPLQERNLRMLAQYYERNTNKIDSVSNNVMINIISRDPNGAFDGPFSSDYIALNIFNLNSQNKANHIFLRYSLMCRLDRSHITVCTDMLLEVAEEVLKSEKQKNGYVDKTPYFDNVHLNSNIWVDVSPMLSYLYVGNSKKAKMIYSPFRDGKLELYPMKVKVFRGTMHLANSPIKSGNLYGKVKLTSYSHRANLVFHGSDIVELCEEKKDYSYGHLVPNTEDGKAYYAHHLNSIRKQK